MKTAILVDGGFCRRRAQKLWGKKTAEARASELAEYCNRNLQNRQHNRDKELYRLFYFDCPPMDKKVFPSTAKSNPRFRKIRFVCMDDRIFERT